MSYAIGDSVKLTKEREGEIKFRGNIDGKKGIFYGIELTSGKGKNDGSIKGKSYFKVWCFLQPLPENSKTKKTPQCAPGNGVFVPKSQILGKTSSKRAVECLHPLGNDGMSC